MFRLILIEYFICFIVVYFFLINFIYDRFIVVDGNKSFIWKFLMGSF